jgi:hypothetical protein
VSVHKLSGSSDTALECNSRVSFWFVSSLTADSDGFDVTWQTATAKSQFCRQIVIQQQYSGSHITVRHSYA